MYNPRVLRHDDAPEPFTLGRLSARGAALWPEALAVKDGGRELTFTELEHAVESFARQLCMLGVLRGDCVALLTDKSLETLIASLAIARAGAAYVPLDPNQPCARLEYMLEDCGARLVIGPEAHARLAGHRRFQPARSCWDQASAAAAQVELPTVAAHDVAYVMYTSGSTGFPKGVLIEHRNVEAFMLAHNARAGVSAGDRCMNTGAFHFDVTVLDVFLPLHFGASVVLTPELPLPSLLLGILARQRITHFYAVGSVLALLTGDGNRLDKYDLSSLRLLQTGAEICNPRVVNEWLRRLPQLRFLNSYGPTELAVGCTSYTHGPGTLPDGDVPIGHIHEGCQAVLVDEAGQLSRGPVGELAVSGPQLMRGYLNRPEEERERIIELGKVRYYRTGDLVRMDASGQLFFLGRSDDEVKLDGHRIHLNEVKRCLEKHPHVDCALVGLVQTAEGRKRIAAALLADPALTVEAAQRWLRQLEHELPTHFRPSALLLCSDLPRTPSGKADVKAALSQLQRRLQETAAGRDSVIDARATRARPSATSSDRLGLQTC